MELVIPNPYVIHLHRSPSSEDLHCIKFPKVDWKISEEVCDLLLYIRVGRYVFLPFHFYELIKYIFYILK